MIFTVKFSFHWKILYIAVIATIWHVLLSRMRHVNTSVCWRWKIVFVLPITSHFKMTQLIQNHCLFTQFTVPSTNAGYSTELRIKRPYVTMIQKRHCLLLWPRQSGKMFDCLNFFCEIMYTTSSRLKRKPSSLMVWGSISVYGTGNLYIWISTINAERHI